MAMNEKGGADMVWPFTESQWSRDMSRAVQGEDNIPEGAIVGALFRWGSVFYRDNPEDLTGQDRED
jgi:hypothetical protein